VSYIQAFKIDAAIPNGDEEIVLGSDRVKVLDNDLDFDALGFAASLLNELDSLGEDFVLVIRKVVF
jgi:hypothetical protein